MFDVCIVGFIFFKSLPVFIESFNFKRKLLLGYKEILILLSETMPCVLSYAFDTDVFIVSLAVEFKGFVMSGAEFMTTSDFFFMTGQLKDDEIFAEHVWFDLRVMFEAAGGAI